MGGKERRRCLPVALSSLSMADEEKLMVRSSVLLFTANCLPYIYSCKSDRPSAICALV